MRLNEYKNIYFVGIGGIGMSAIARYFNNKNVNIFGYDRIKSSLCMQLENEGMNIHYTEDISQILVKKDDTLVVYTPAIDFENKELSYFLNNNYIVMKRSEVLGKITENHFTIAVAGTHGKTTTSTMIAHILHQSGIDCTAFLGGVSINYHSNIIFGTEKSVFVVEADEFDRSFLTISPDIAVITSIDEDHLDVYENKDMFISAFFDFTNNIKNGGTLFLEENIDMSIINRQDISVFKYGSSIRSDFQATNITSENNVMKFKVSCNDEIFNNFNLHMGGRYNVFNALAAFSVANLLDIEHSHIVDGINSFLGIERRFVTHIFSEKLMFIDDYAHHPKEVKECINAVKEMYPRRKITVIFQPHLYSRTKHFLKEFAESLSLADEIIILEIYGAREQAIKGVSSKLLLSKCTSDKKELSTLDSIVENISIKDIDILLTLGAGDISTIIKPLKLKLS